MTTTINLNFLNFFGLKFNTHSAYNDVRVDDRHPEREQDQSTSRERIIDVTEYSRGAYSEEKDSTQIETNSYAKRLAISRDVIARTYDRKGKSVQFVYQKGLHIDSYV